MYLTVLTTHTQKENNMKNKKRAELALIEDILDERLWRDVDDGEKLKTVAQEILDILVERGYLNED